MKNVGYGLKNISIPESNKYFKVVDNIILSKDRTSLIMSSLNRENLVIPDSVKTICAASIRGFTIKKIKSIFGNTQLKEITVPSSCASIDSNAFGNCYNLEKIKINKNENTISDAPWEHLKG